MRHEHCRKSLPTHNILPFDEQDFNFPRVLYAGLRSQADNERLTIYFASVAYPQNENQ